MKDQLADASAAGKPAVPRTNIQEQGLGLVNIQKPRADLDERVYKLTPDAELRLHIFYPPGYRADGPARYPVAASIHGGGWREGPIEWGHADAQFMATLGFVGIAVEYRLADYQSVSVLDCIKDANSAIRWIRGHSQDLRIHPDQVLAIGHSAGAHLALCTAMFPQLKDAAESDPPSSVPNAVVALAPAVELQSDEEFSKMLRGRMPARDCSPIDHISRLPMPVLVIHGTHDEALSIAPVREFTRRMNDQGSRIELHEHDGGDHGFFYGEQKGVQFWHNLVARFVAQVFPRR